MTDNVEKKPLAKPVAAAAKAPKTKLAVALHRIDGTIEPGTALALGAKDYNELLELEAIREPNEGEVALFEKNPESVKTLGGAATDLDSVLD